MSTVSTALITTTTLYPLTILVLSIGRLIHTHRLILNSKTMKTVLASKYSLKQVELWCRVEPQKLDVVVVCESMYKDPWGHARYAADGDLLGRDLIAPLDWPFNDNVVAATAMPERFARFRFRVVSCYDLWVGPERVNVQLKPL